MAVSISLSITQNSQNIANNTSNVTVKVTAKWTYGSWNANSKSGWLKIDGTKYTFSSSFNTGQSTSGSQTLFTKTVNVSHNTDGSKTLSCSASYTSGVSSGTVTASASKTLTKIARKSSISSVSGGNLGAASTITVSRQSTSLTHTLTYKCGTATGTIATKSSSTSIPWTPPLELAKQNTKGLDLTVDFTLETFNGTTSLGTSTWKSNAYKIPAASVTPSASITVATDTYKTKYGAYVQGKSKPQIDVTASGAYNATITSYKTEVDGKTYTTSAFTTDVLSGSGTKTITTTVTDSRQQPKTVTTNIDVLAYSAPQITSLSVKRSTSSGGSSSSGAHLTVTFSSAVSPLNNKNTATYKIQYKKTTDTTYSSPETLVDYANNYAVTNGTYTFAADTASSYDVLLTVTDGIEDSNKMATGSSISKLWSILGQGKGFAIGKVAELTNYFDVAWQSLFRNHVGIGSKQTGTDGKPGTFIHKDGIVYIQRDDSQGYHPYIGFLHGTETELAAQVRSNCNSRYIEFLSAQGYRFGNKMIIPNNKFFFAEDTSGTEINLFGLNNSNNLLVGWDLYDKALGNTAIYGNQVRFNANNGFYFNGNKLGSHIVDTGTTGNWKWVKYITDSGEKIYDTWMSYYGSYSITTATGNLYKTAKMPANGFIDAVGSTYIIYALADCNGEETWATISEHGENSLYYTLLSASSRTGNFWVNLYVRGTWA